MGDVLLRHLVLIVGEPSEASGKILFLAEVEGCVVLILVLSAVGSGARRIAVAIERVGRAEVQVGQEALTIRVGLGDVVVDLWRAHESHRNLVYILVCLV